MLGDRQCAAAQARDPSLDHAPVQPHTAGRQARSCESCHNNPKTLGYGIEDGRFMLGYENDLVVDVKTATGQIVPQQYKVQSPAIPGLDHDLSQIITRDGEQLVTVGSHWPVTTDGHQLFAITSDNLR